MSFTGRHAVVTGGSSGIGLAVVRRLARDQAAVSVLALGDSDLARLGAEGPDGVRTFPVDVSDRDQVLAAVAEATDTSGAVDLLATCAGVVRPGYFSDLDPAEFRREMDVNYFGTLWAMRAVAGPMVACGEGTIMAVPRLAGAINDHDVVKAAGR